MKRLMGVLLVLLMVVSCSSEEKEFAFPIVPPQEVYGGTTLNFLVKFDRDIDSVGGENLPYNAVFKQVASNEALFQYSPSVTEEGVKIFKLFAEAGGKKVYGSIQVTVLQPNLRVNYPPLISVPDQIVVREGDVVDFSVSAKDPEGEQVVVTVKGTDVPAGYSFDGREFLWHTDYSSSGNYYVEFFTTDGLHPVTAVTSIKVLNSAPDPLLYTTSVSYTIHEGESVELLFSNLVTDPSWRIYLEKDIEGMSLQVSGTTVKLSFTPGFAYNGGEIVKNAIISENDLFRRVINLSFRIVNEGSLVVDSVSTGAILSYPVYNRYAFFINSNGSDGDVYLLDFYSEYPEVVSGKLDGCQKLFYAGFITDGSLIYSCYNGSQLVGSANILYGEEVTFAPIAETSVSMPDPDVYFSQNEPFWTGVWNNHMFSPDYTATNIIKVLRFSKTQTPFEEIPDTDWVADPPADNSPTFDTGTYGIALVSDGLHILVSSNNIYDWDTPVSGNSEKLAVLTAVNSRIGNVAPVILPEDFVEADSIYHPIFIDDPGVVVIVDGTGYRGYYGVLAYNGINFISSPITFHAKVDKLIKLNPQCFIALYDGGLKGQRYCFINNEFEPVSVEMDFSSLTQGWQVLNMSIEGGRVFLLSENNGEVRLLSFPETLLR